MRFHVVSLPHTQTTRAYSHCAYTEKVRKFCDMMSVNHEVFLYSGRQRGCRQAHPVHLQSGPGKEQLPRSCRHLQDRMGRGPALLAGDEPSCCFGNQPPKEGR